MAETLHQRLDNVLDHIEELHARAKEIVLTEADFSLFRDEIAGGNRTDSYREVPLRCGQIGGSSYVAAEGTPSGETNFGV